jgi:hypothetical protein
MCDKAQRKVEGKLGNATQGGTPHLTVIPGTAAADLARLLAAAARPTV